MLRILLRDGVRGADESSREERSTTGMEHARPELRIIGETGRKQNTVCGNPIGSLGSIKARNRTAETEDKRRNNISQNNRHLKGWPLQASVR